MPSAQHETPIALARLDPILLTWLLANVFGVKVLPYDHARPGQYRSELLRRLHADGWTEGKAEGRAEGERQAVLIILEARGVTVPDEVRGTITACSDLAVLEVWMRRAATATTAAEVVAPIVDHDLTVAKPRRS